MSLWHQGPPDQSLDPARVGRPPVAAQFQR